MLDDQVEQRLDALARRRLVERRGAELRVGVDDREVDLRLVGVLVEEELVHLVDDLGDARVAPVDLVDDEDHRQPPGERLAQDEPRLRQRPLRGVDQEQHPVDHREAAFHLAAEVGVAGRVDDVDLGLAVADGGVLGEDRDAALALEAGVHHPVDPLLVRGEGARLAQERVHERRLPMVDVGDDRDVADVVACVFGCRACGSQSSRFSKKTRGEAALGSPLRLAIAEPRIPRDVLDHVLVGVEAELREPERAGLVLGVRHEPPPEPGSLSRGIDGDVLDEEVVGHRHEDDHPDDRPVTVGDGHATVADQPSVVGVHRRRPPADPLDVAAVGGLDEALDRLRSPGSAGRRISAAMTRS